MYRNWCLFCKTISKDVFFFQISKENKSALTSTTLLGAYPISYITIGHLVEFSFLFIFVLGLNACNSIGGKVPFNDIEAGDANSINHTTFLV